MGDKQIYGFSQRLWRWLERMGFTEDPFALYEAEKEGESLLSFYVDRPYLYDILGDPGYPQTAFLMARRGQGKTASREIVAYQCMYGKLRRRALAVRYSDFSPLLNQVEGDIARITPRHHVENIIRQTLKTLVEEVPATYFELLDEIERSLLMGYAEAFADPISKLRLSKFLEEDTPFHCEWQNLSSVEMLTSLAEIFVHLGQTPERTYQSLYILVDRVDETSAGSDAAVALLKPLINDKVLLETPNVAFKFFLPVEVGQALHRVANLRPDRLCTRVIDWDREALQDVVRQRLTYYSNGKIESLGNLCTSSAKAQVMDRLIKASGNSPRTLLRLCRALVHNHVARTDEAFINTTDITNTLLKFSHQVQIMTPSPSEISSKLDVETKSPSTSKEDGLYIGDSGHVWIDGQRLTPPLTQQEFQLLRMMYVRSPNIVTHEELIEVIWPESSWQPDEVYTEQNLRKLISRVRKRLEPGVPAKQSRFLKNVRGRGYWLSPE
jgi:DNA-binding response OmpR family regulator